MDNHTTVEILRGCLTNPTADSPLVYAVLRLTPNPRNALVLYRPQALPSTSSEAVFPAELFEMILVELAKDCPSSLLTNATRVNSLFRDTIRDSQSIMIILFKDTDVGPSAATLSSNSTTSSNPALRKFDIGVVTEWPPTMERHYPENKHSINGHVFAFSSSFHRRPWAEIQLSAGDEHHIVLSCDDMRLFDLPQVMELHVRYQVDSKEVHARKPLFDAIKSTQSIIATKSKCPSTIYMVAMARTKATTVKDLFELARELKKHHPENWEERESHFGRGVSMEARFTEPGNTAQEMLESSVKFREIDGRGDYIGRSTMAESWVSMQQSSSYAICSMPMTGVDMAKYGAVAKAREG